MLQVHNELSRHSERRDSLIKTLTASIAKERKSRTPDQEKVTLWDQQLEAVRSGGVLPEDANDPALPGYILLIDEPENALHPMAARAAQAHLYELAKHQDWQVLLTTHSPYFVNPLEDHTTIVRLERAPDGRSISPRMYVADDANFATEEKSALQALQLMDVGFSEIFFGSYPILVEGDTEHAAYLAAIVMSKHDLASKVSVIRARGKAILVPLIKMLRHFKTDFGILHDIDWPFNLNGASNGMWTVNERIRDQIVECRNAGMKVRHRWSTPDFERFMDGDELGKDKPFTAFDRVLGNEALSSRMVDLIKALYIGEEHDPSSLNSSGTFDSQIRESLNQWAAASGHTKDCRLTGQKLS